MMTGKDAYRERGRGICLNVNNDNVYDDEKLPNVVELYSGFADNVNR